MDGKDSSLTLLDRDGRFHNEISSRARHLLDETMYSAQHRVAFKGQIFSAPMDWYSMQQQLEQLDKEETRVVLPLTGELLTARVSLSISSGLVDLNKKIKQLTVRRDVAVQLIAMHDTQTINGLTWKK